MMAHAKITKCQMLDWIKETIELGTPAPTDEAIVDRFNLSGVESARALLAALADEGAITIGWNKPGRPLALGPRERRRPASPTPIPSVVKPDVALDAGVEKIMRIVGRTLTRTAPSPIPAAPPQAAVTVARGEIKRLPTAPGRAPRQPGNIGARQINAKLDAATYAAVEGIAFRHGLAVGAMCRMLITEALTARQSGLRAPGKPRIPAAVMAAYLADGREFGAFIEHLLGLGLTEHKAMFAEVEA